MKKVHFSNSESLSRALLLLKEESPEFSRQKEMEKKIKGKEVNEADDDEEDKKKDKNKKEKPPEDKGDEGDDEGDKEEAPKEDAEKKEEPAPEKPKKPTTLPGAKRLEDSELPKGQKPSMKDIVQRINFVRAGASLKDEKVKRNIATWITQLTQPERETVFTTLDAIAQILLAKKSAAEAPTFSDSGLEIDDNDSGDNVGGTILPSTKVKPLSTHSKIKKKISTNLPITVGEGVVRKLKEVDVPVKSGRVVPFGSKAHIDDITQRIEDLKRIRSYQERGSDSYQTLGLAITSLKKILVSAHRSNGGGNPRTQPVAPMVEKEKEK